MSVSFLTVLPLAFVMVAGPQIISAILLATGHDARRNSLAFLLGAALAITAGTMLAYWITSQLKRAAGPSGQGTASEAAAPSSRFTSGRATTTPAA
jgi:small neutral amino acid transporter SnatA (MarC family)